MNYHADRQPPVIKRKIPPLLVLVLVLAGFWWFFIAPDKRLDPDAVPRPVTARGDLALDEQNTIDIFRATSGAVVYITSIEYRRSLFSLNVYEIPQGTGSGFVWDKDGRIVTNYHVIGDANRVEVTLADHSTWKGTLVGVSPDKDLAVLQISAPADQLKPIPVGEAYNLQVGQKVFAIGNPFGLDQTITAGIVSALGREIKAVTGRTIQGVIQTDAAINPGNSGGPLLDSAGRLIGVNTAIYSPSGGSAGIGFAVPVDVVNRVVPEIIKYGQVIRPGIGVTTIADDRIIKRLGIDGVLVINVQPGSTAEASGIRGTRKVGGEIVLGDIIQEIGGRKISTYDDLRNALDRYHVGDEIILGILRDEKKIEVKVALERVG
ncbi:MAG: trypsin-like peptidase domain-containing protein [Proteobacteria bacterium]|nr:trypsin-like peptidase domain-containing protein [Pseudomonadota bacterium]MBU1711305.1 trypsin-like peptidase domain-containing protein [Pseudomonadota bacterium]